MCEHSSRRVAVPSPVPGVRLYSEAYAGGRRIAHTVGPSLIVHSPGHHEAGWLVEAQVPPRPAAARLCCRSMITSAARPGARDTASVTGGGWTKKSLRPPLPSVGQSSPHLLTSCPRDSVGERLIHQEPPSRGVHAGSRSAGRAGAEEVLTLNQITTTGHHSEGERCPRQMPYIGALQCLHPERLLPVNGFC